MGAPFLGSEALAAGVTWTELQNRHRRLLRDVYVTADFTDEIMEELG